MSTYDDGTAPVEARGERPHQHCCLGLFYSNGSPREVNALLPAQTPCEYLPDGPTLRQPSNPPLPHVIWEATRKAPNVPSGGWLPDSARSE